VATIALDLDGVCYEWSRTARYMLRTYRGADLQGEAKVWDWNISEGVSPVSWDWLWTEGVSLGLFRYGHMVKDCRVGLQELTELGYKLKVVTHRPAEAVNDTLDWISFYMRDVPLAGIHIFSNQEPKSQVDADILIDDRQENVQEWRETGRPAILFDRPWNQSYEHDPSRAYGWNGVLDLLDEVVV
jgi:5'(3')-deoxyribonucleotidase